MTDVHGRSASSREPRPPETDHFQMRTVRDTLWRQKRRDRHTGPSRETKGRRFSHLRALYLRDGACWRHLRRPFGGPKRLLPGGHGGGDAIAAPRSCPRSDRLGTHWCTRLVSCSCMFNAQLSSKRTKSRAQACESSLLRRRRARKSPRNKSQTPAPEPPTRDGPHE